MGQAQADRGRPSSLTGLRPGALALPASTAATAFMEAWLDEYVATSVPCIWRSTYGSAPVWSSPADSDSGGS